MSIFHFYRAANWLEVCCHLFGILYCNVESSVSDVTVNGVKYRCGGSISLMPALSIL